MSLNKNFLIALFALSPSLVNAEQYRYQATVISIANGDIITVLNANKQQHKFRLQGIDAPEKSQAFGKVSRHYLSQLDFSKSVTIEYENLGRYQRLVR